MPEPLIVALAQRLACSPEEAEAALYQLVARWQQQLQQSGQVVIPGLGGFYQTAQGLRFEPAGALAQAVNYRFAGLESVTIEPAEEQAYRKTEVVPPEVPEETALAEDIEATTPEVFPPSEALLQTSEPESTAVSPNLEDTLTSPATEPPQPIPEAVKPATAHRPVETSPPPRPPRIHLHEERTRKLPLWIPAALVVVILGAIGVWWLLSMRPTSPVSSPPIASPPASTAMPAETTTVATTPQTDTVQPSPTLPEAPTRGNYALVIGSTTNRAVAEQMAEQFRQRLAGQGLAIEIVTAPANGTTRYRIVVGQYPSAEAALAAKERLGDLVPTDAWVLRLSTN